jgi:hypothetical protein
MVMVCRLFDDTVSGPDGLTSSTRRALMGKKATSGRVDVSLHVEKFGYAVSMRCPLVF